MNHTHNVLFLCTGNSCRSQMAEGFLRLLGEDRFVAYSAGTKPAHEVHPLAVAVMQEKGIDISRQRPKGVKEFFGKLAVHHLILVCHGADKSCPRIFPGMLNRHFWPFEARLSLWVHPRLRQRISARFAMRLKHASRNGWRHKNEWVILPLSRVADIIHTRMESSI